MRAATIYKEALKHMLTSTERPCDPHTTTFHYRNVMGFVAKLKRLLLPKQIEYIVERPVSWVDS